MNPSSLSRIEHGRVNPTMAVVLRIARALGLSPAELLAMQPGTEREGACPVSARGQCLLDLIDNELDADPAQRKERYSLRQLRLLRRFALLVRQDDKDLEKALETLLERIRGTGGV